LLRGSLREFLGLAADSEQPIVKQVFSFMSGKSWVNYPVINVFLIKLFFVSSLVVSL